MSGTIINSPALAPPLDMEQHLQSAGGNTSTGERPIAHLLLFAVGACLGAGAFVCGTTSNIAGAVLLGIMALSFVGMGAHWQSKLCPQCHAYAAQEVSRQPIRSERIMMTSRTIDTHKDNHGNFIGSTDRKIVVPILVTDYTLNYRCTNCGHEWKRHDQEQEEERL